MLISLLEKTYNSHICHHLQLTNKGSFIFFTFSFQQFCHFLQFWNPTSFCCSPDIILICFKMIFKNCFLNHFLMFLHHNKFFPLFDIAFGGFVEIISIGSDITYGGCWYNLFRVFNTFSIIFSSFGIILASISDCHFSCLHVVKMNILLISTIICVKPVLKWYIWPNDYV